MKNIEVLKKLDVEKAKKEFGCRYKAVMMLLNRIPADYDYESIDVRHGDLPDDYIELILRSCYMSTTIAVKNREVIKCLDRFDKRNNARCRYVVPLREILMDDYVRKVDDFIFFK